MKNKHQIINNHSILSLFIKIFSNAFFIFMLGICPLISYAENKPVTITAYLANEFGPLNGTYPIRVSLLNSSNTVIWEETHNIIFTKGNFNLPIGGGTHSTPLTPELIDLSSKLQITAAGETVALGFTSTFYSYLAQNADNATTANVALLAKSISWENITGKPSDLGSATTYSAGDGLKLNGNQFSIQNNVVTTNFHGTLTAEKFSGDGSLLTNVTADSVSDGVISNQKISNDAAIAFSKLSISKADIVGLGIPSEDSITTNATKLQQRTVSSTAPSTGQVLKWDGSSWAPDFDAGGTSYTAGNGLALVGSAFTLAGNSVSTNALQESSVSTAKLADSSVTFAKLAAHSVSSANLMDGAVFNEDINPSANIAFSKLAISKSDIVALGIPSADTSTTNATKLQQRNVSESAPSTGQVLKWDGSSWAPDFDAGGTSYTAGNGLSLVGSAFTLAGNSVSTNALQESSVSTAKLADSSVTLAKLAANAVSSANLMDGAVFNEDINPSANIAFSKLAISKSDIVGLGIPSADTSTTNATKLQQRTISSTEPSTGQV